MNLAKLTTELKDCLRDAQVRIELVGDPTAGGLMVPDELDSYRGFYDQLALGYRAADDATGCTVGSLVAALEGADGQTFEGYKGGDYTMSGDTSVWCSNYGMASGWGIGEVVGRSAGLVVIRAFDFNAW